MTKRSNLFLLLILITLTACINKNYDTKTNSIFGRTNFVIDSLQHAVDSIKQVKLTNLIQLIIQNKDTIPDSLSLALLQHYDKETEELYSLDWVHVYKKHHKDDKNYVRQINLDKDSLAEVIIQLFDIHSTIFILDYQKGNWVLLEKFNCPLIQPFGMAPPPGEYTLYESEQLLSFDLCNSNGSHGVWGYEFSIHKVIGDSLKKILSLQYGGRPLSIKDCLPYFSTSISPTKVTKEKLSFAVFYDYHVYDLNCIKKDYYKELTLLKDHGTIHFEYDSIENIFKRTKIEGFDKHPIDSLKIEAILESDGIKFTQLFLNEIMSLADSDSLEQKKVVEYLKQDTTWNYILNND